MPVKRIIICADGTWNVRDQQDKTTGKRRPTNVTKLARAIVPRVNSVDQVVLYAEGIGTDGGTDKYTGGAFGHGIEDNVRYLYRFIVYNFEPGDELFFFGFSRGAFTVRTLAGFMHFAGLIEKDDDYYLPEIYSCYERSCGPGTPDWEHAHRKVRGTRPPPPIKMIGVWDTVGALGAPGFLGRVLNKNKYAYHDIGLNPSIESAFHALAIDERRGSFEPNLFVRPDAWSGTLVQTWFAGVHSNVGGSYTPDGLANEALHWMTEMAEAKGLVVDSTYLSHFAPRFDSKLHDSMTMTYRALGTHVRPIGAHLMHGEAIHRSAIQRVDLKDGYEPPNLLAAQLGGTTLPIVDTTRVKRGPTTWDG